MSGPTLAERVADDRVHVLDGAMGTMLYERGVFVNVCYDALALERPDLVRAIHGEYVAAGAEVLETNTFGANPFKLSGHALADETERINRAAAHLAREAADEATKARDRARVAERVHVLGAIGPLGVRIEPWGPTSEAEAEAAFGRQVAGLLDGGVDGFCLETFADPNELAAAYRAVRAATARPVFAQMTVGQQLTTAYGTDVPHLAAELTELGAEVIGLNCSVGPATILDGIEEMATLTDRPLSAQPNAGLPRTVRDRTMYMARPEYMARYTQRLIEAGARFVGGCCGTTPEHVARISDVVRSVQPRHVTVRGAEPGTEAREDAARRPGNRALVSDPAAEATVEEIPLAERSRLGAALAAGRFVTSVELLPPRGWATGELLEVVGRLGEEGTDLVSLVDSPRGGRLGSIAAALAILRSDEGAPDAPTGGPAGGAILPEPLVHYTCRDRNMMGMVADLLGAAAGGVKNLLLVSGDPPVQGPYPDSTAVFDIDSIGLTNVAREMNRGVDPGGAPIGSPTPFVTGVAANHAAVDLDREVERFMWKVGAGADFAVTQPVFDGRALRDFLERTDAWPIPVVVGLWPLGSARNAEFLTNEVPGIVVPDAVVERMRSAEAERGDRARAEGIRIALEVLDAVRPLERVAGVAVSVPEGDVDAALEVVRAARVDAVG